MKTIFRSTFTTMLFAVIIALGTGAVFGQDPAADACKDSDAMSKAGDEFRRLFTLNKDVPSRKATIASGEDFLAKYGRCPGQADTDADSLSAYLRKTLPSLKTKVKTLEEGAVKDVLVKRFDDALKAKNWDEVYASGKELLAKFPDEYRAAELVLGSIGLDENINNKVTKWNADTLRYARISLADLESGKKFPTYGVGTFSYKNQGDAIGWMNYTIGYILSLDKSTKKEGASYLYKASLAASDTKSNPVVYDTIGGFYFEDAKALYDEVNALIAAQSDKDTPEIRQQKVDAIKAKMGVFNGTAERAMDAYSRAYTLAPSTPAGKAYRDGLYKKISDLYKIRFQKSDGLDAWVKSVAVRPMPDPTTAILPIVDADPATTTTTSTSTTVNTAAPAAAKPPASVKDAATAPASKPATTVAAKKPTR